MVLAQIQKQGMVQSLMGRGGGGVQIGVWWTSTVALNIDDGASPDWEAGDGAHTCRGVHGILELTTGCVCWLVCGEPVHLHLTSMMLA